MVGLSVGWFVGDTYCDFWKTANLISIKFGTGVRHLNSPALVYDILTKLAIRQILSYRK